MKYNLQNIRDEIDKIDKQLVELFERRMEIVKDVAQYKIENNMQVLDKEREKQVIKKNIGFLKNKKIEVYAAEYFDNLMSVSRKMQKDIIDEYKHNKMANVSYQGVPGSFSEQALTEYFKEYKKVNAYNVSEFRDVFEALKNDKIDCGVLPIENSSTGGISQVYDLLREYEFSIVGERCIKVNHNLLGIKGTKIEDIKEVYSHTQAFQQSSEFLKNHSSWKLIPYQNTAVSAKYIKDEGDKQKAAIASRKAMELYDLELIQENINFNHNNFTRFIIIGKQLNKSDECNKVSVVFSLPHKAGLLYDALRIFSDNNVNMMKIESRPMLDKSWEYFFYIDFEGNLNDENVKTAVETLKEFSYYFKLLGNYKSHRN